MIAFFKKKTGGNSFNNLKQSPEALPLTNGGLKTIVTPSKVIPH